jgi:predicted permease
LTLTGARTPDSISGEPKKVNPISASVSRVAPVFFLFLLGFFLKRIGFFGEGFVQDLKKIVMYTALPCLLFTAFSSIVIHISLVYLFAMVFAVCLLMLLIGKGVARIPRIVNPYFPPMMTGFETGMVGYALFTSVYGSDSLSAFAAVDLGQLIFVWTVLVLPLTRLKTGRDVRVSLLRMCFTSPVVIGILLGLCVALMKRTGIVDWSAEGLSPLRGIVYLLGGLTTPLICLAIGHDFSVDRRALRLSGITTGARLGILAPLGILLGRVFLRRALGLGPLYERALLTMFILPPPFVYALFLAERDDESRLYVSGTLSLHTAVSLFTFAAISTFIGQVP